MNIRQEIALALKCGIEVPDFKVVGSLEDAQSIELLQTPDWEFREDIIFNSPDNTVTQYYYFDGKELKHPLIGIDDPYLLSGRQGGKLDCNLLTMFAGELKIEKHLKELTEYFIGINHKGYISLTFAIFNNRLCYNKIELGVPDDVIKNILNLYQQDIDWYISDLENNTLPEPKGISVSLRLYAYPYYTENNLALLDNIPVVGAYQLTDCYAVCYWQEKFHIKDCWSTA